MPMETWSIKPRELEVTPRAQTAVGCFNDGGQSSSSGVFVNGTPQTTFQDAGFANGGALSGFNFTLINSKIEANQNEANAFSRSPDILYILLPGTLVVAALVAIAAAFQRSKWWLLALVGPASGALLLLTAGV